LDTEGPAFGRDLDPHIAEGLNRSQIVLAPRKIENAALPVGDASKNDRAVADGLVSRDAYFSVRRLFDWVDSFHV
jgi:hypothetical protein